MARDFFISRFSVVQDSKEFWHLFVSIHVPPSDELWYLLSTLYYNTQPLTIMVGARSVYFDGRFW